MVESGKLKTPLMVYPEGACCRQSEMIQFKIGAFLSLCSIQPISVAYDCLWGIAPDTVNGRPHTAFFLTSCMPPFGSIHHKVYPVFRPNEYFWSHHWKKDEESQATCYMRVIRQIMIDHEGYNDNSSTCEDQFEYNRISAGESFNALDIA